MANLVNGPDVNEEIPIACVTCTMNTLNFHFEDNIFYHYTKYYTASIFLNF